MILQKFFVGKGIPWDFIYLFLHIYVVLNSDLWRGKWLIIMRIFQVRLIPDEVIEIYWRMALIFLSNLRLILVLVIGEQFFFFKDAVKIIEEWVNIPTKRVIFVVLIAPDRIPAELFEVLHGNE